MPMVLIHTRLIQVPSLMAPQALDVIVMLCRKNLP